MNFVYRNNLNQTIRFSLGNPPHLIEYAVSPGSTVVIPEKYDYAIEAMGVRLEKDYEQSIVHDSVSNPERWSDFLNSESSASESEFATASKPSNGISLHSKRAIRSRKK